MSRRISELKEREEKLAQEIQKYRRLAEKKDEQRIQIVEQMIKSGGI